MADNAFPFDVKFTVGSDEYGFMLVSPKGQSKQLVIQEVGGPDAQRVSNSAIATHQDYPPAVDTPFAMGDFAGGAGQLYYEEGDDTAYLWSTGIVTHTNGKAYLAPVETARTLTNGTGAVTSWETYVTSAGVRYDFAVEGTRLWRRNASTDSAWAIVYTASTDITDFKVIDGKGLIAVPGSSDPTDFRMQSDVTAAATWTPTSMEHSVFSTSLGKPRYFYNIRGTTYALVGTKKVFYSADPSADGWIGPINTSLAGNSTGSAGDSTYQYTGVISVGDFIFVMRNDVIYSIDASQNVIEVIWEWKDRPSDNNFKYYASGSDKFIFSVANEVFMYEPQTGVTRPMLLSRRSGFSTKEILGVGADNQFVYVLAKLTVPTISANDRVALMRCYRGQLGWNVEVLWEDTSLTNKTYGNMFVVPDGFKTRVYWALDNSTGDSTVYQISLPAEWDESRTSGYRTSATLYTSLCRSGFPGFNKRHLYLNAEIDNVSGTVYITPSYSLDKGATYTALNQATTGQYESSYIDKYSKEIGLAFAFTGVTGTSPVLRNFDHHQRIRFKYLQSLQAVIRIAKNIELRNRSVQSLTPDVLFGWIQTLRQTNGRIKYDDFLGNSFDVSIDSISVNPTRHESIAEYEEAATIIFTRADRGG